MAKLPNRFQRTVEAHLQDALRGFRFKRIDAKSLKRIRGMVEQFLRARMDNPCFRLECDGTDIWIVTEDKATRDVLDSTMESETRDTE